MGPRLDSRGRLESALARRPRGLLQWGRGWTAAEGAILDRWCLRVEVLQWGRGWTAAEGPRGPVRETSPPTGFNGAAAGQPRKAHLREPVHELLRCFNGAAAGQPRKAESLG